MNTLFAKLVEAETNFKEQEFLAPVLRGQKVKIKINSIVMDLLVRPKTFEGWGIFKTSDFKTARRIREADVFERTSYLELFPAVRAVVVKVGDNFQAIPLPDNRFKITGMIPVQLPNDLEQFEIACLHYDGSNFWFGQTDPDGIMIADYLRSSLGENKIPNKLSHQGLLKEHLDAYIFATNEKKKLTELSFDGRIQGAVIRGGGVYKSHKKIANNQFTVTYEIDGSNYTSTVNNGLFVESAGICLSGTDKNFDLQSLMSVIREGQNRRLIHRTR
jgi:hypothetical protein